MTDHSSDQKQYVEEQELLNDSYRLAVKIYESGFRPDFIVGVWRGGSTVGIYVQECLQYLGVEADHIAIRTSYQGRDEYQRRLDQPEDIRVHGMQYLFENMNQNDSLLIVDDVFSSGQNIEAVVNRLQKKTKRNMPRELKVAVPFYRPANSRTSRIPDYNLHETDKWLVLPYELTDLSPQEISENKPWVVPLLNKIQAKKIDT